MTCSICLKPINYPGNPITKCNHTFHLNCLYAWVQEQYKSDNTISCPMCRTDITAETPTYYYWDNKDIKLYRNKDTESRWYPNKNIKYYIYLDNNNNFVSGNFFNSNGENISHTLLTAQEINKLRTDDHYTNSIIY